MRRTTESIAFYVPDRNALWSRAEDDLLVRAVAKYSTSNILGRDWIEVASEVPGRLPQQCQEHYRLPDILAELTFVFLCVTFCGSPCAPVTSLLCVSNDSSSKDDTPDFMSPPSPTPSPFSPSSLMHVHRCIGYRNPTV